MKIPRPLLGAVLLGLVVGTVWATVPSGWTASSTMTTKKDSPWQLQGKGNLEAVRVDGHWMLHSVPTTYIQMLGIQGKKYELLSPTVYTPATDADTPAMAVPASLTTLKTPNGHALRVLKTDKGVYDATSERSQMLADGRLVFADSEHENIWLVDSTGKVEPLLDNSGMTEVQQLADRYWKSGEMYGRVIWSSRPQVSSDGKTVLFYSNRDTVKDKFFADNVYAVNVTEGKPRLVFEAKKYKQGVQLINSVGHTVIGYIGATNTLLVHDLKKATTTETALNGYPTSLSPDERTLLYRKVDAQQVVGLDFYLRDLTSGTDKVVKMPEGYFFNQIGAWSPDGKHFAFYLNGFHDNQPNKQYRTNVLIGVIDVAKAKIAVYNPPPGSATLYPLGSLSWLDNSQVIAATTDDASWALTID